MNLIGALDTPTCGSYRINGNDVEKLTDDQLADLRNTRDRLRLPDLPAALPLHRARQRRAAARLPRPAPQGAERRRR